MTAPGRRGITLPPSSHASLIRDASFAEGPLAGLLSGLEVVRPERLALVVGGDMPELQRPVLEEMLRTAGDADGEAVALREGGRLHPLPCVVGAGAAATAARGLLAGGQRSLRAMLESLRLTVIEEDVWTPLDPGRRTLVDVDELPDLR